jgi:hypothetical protein
MTRERVDRIVDIASVVLISAAAVLSAMSGYESGRWGGQRTRLYNMANASRLRSAEEADRSIALTAIDVTLFLHYVDAVDAGDARKAQFLYRRFRPEARPAMRAWLATKPLQNPNAPSSPFAMPQYALASNASSQENERRASASFDAAQAANRHADEFLLLTVIFASVSFLAGVSTKMAYPRHLVVVVVGTLALIYGLTRLITLPLLF